MNSRWSSLKQWTRPSFPLFTKSEPKLTHSKHFTNTEYVLTLTITPCLEITAYPSLSNKSIHHSQQKQKPTQMAHIHTNPNQNPNQQQNATAAPSLEQRSLRCTGWSALTCKLIDRQDAGWNEKTDDSHSDTRSESRKWPSTGSQQKHSPQLTLNLHFAISRCHPPSQETWLPQNPNTQRGRLIPRELLRCRLRQRSKLKTC